MLFESIPGKYKVFFAGADKSLSITQLHKMFRVFGPIHKLATKVRSPNLDKTNGFGIITTNCEKTFNKFMSIKDKYVIEDSCIEFKEYKTDLCYSVLNDMNKNYMYVKGFHPDNSIEYIKSIILRRFNPKMIKSISDVDYTPANFMQETKIVKIEFTEEKYKNLIEYDFPMRIGSIFAKYVHKDWIFRQLYMEAEDKKISQKNKSVMILMSDMDPSQYDKAERKIESMWKNRVHFIKKYKRRPSKWNVKGNFYPRNTYIRMVATDKPFEVQIFTKEDVMELKAMYPNFNVIKKKKNVNKSQEKIKSDKSTKNPSPKTSKQNANVVNSDDTSSNGGSSYLAEPLYRCGYSNGAHVKESKQSVLLLSSELS
jgi:hypothetical protein